MSEWERAGESVRRRREQLGLAQGERPPSQATWRKVEHGIDPPYRRATVTALCRSLGWTEDSYDRLLAGDDPIVVDAPTGVEPTLLAAVIDLTEAVRELRADLRAGRR